jgi:hypothetical protein
MYPYRVFISYSHADRALVERLVKVLEEAGVAPLWDNELLPGTGFSEQIQTFITNCHVVIPFITAASAERPWLHQEIGFAVALGKPVLPVTLGQLPSGIIGGVQAVQLREDLADAPDKLAAGQFQRLVESTRDRPAAYECPEDNPRRALLLARYADSLWAIQRFGQVRQMVSLSTFQLPDRGPADPVWKSYFPATPDDRFLFDALRRERVALERHARKGGCRLILDPVERLEAVYRRHGPGSVRTRVDGLLRFLRDDSLSDIVVAINDDAERMNSVTIVGDWFSAEAVFSGGTRVLREALFTRDAPTVRQHVLDFDNRMRDLLAHHHWDARSTRTEAISYLDAYVRGLPDR